jgi:hypothetical protein
MYLVCVDVLCATCRSLRNIFRMYLLSKPSEYTLYVCICCVLFAESFEISLECIDCLNRQKVLPEYTLCVCVFLCCLQRPSKYCLLVRYPYVLSVLEQQPVLIGR